MTHPGAFATALDDDDKEERRRARHRARSKKYYESHREICEERNKRWRQAHPDAARAIARRCKAKRKTTHPVDHRAHYLKYGKPRYAKHPEECRAKAARWRQAHPDKVRAMKVSRYGIELSDYEAIRQSQGGVCAICHGETDGPNSRRRLAIDHDHATGAVRGLLCGRCNRGLGLFRDTPAFLRNAAAYLERAQCHFKIA